MNGFINLNKPLGLTSFACIAKLRKILGIKKIGHAGTLDPDAGGVLPVAVGKATRLLEYVTAESKNYRATMTIGIKTTTQDASGEVINTINSRHITACDILNILPIFEGTIEQIPPMYSAIKVSGKRLYELARKNIEVERAPRWITIHKIELLDYISGEYPTAVFDVSCSKGTYIRTLLEDIGEKLHSTAHMSALERTAVGKFVLDNSVSFETIEKQIAAHNMEFLLPLDFPLDELGIINVDSESASKIRHGNAIPLNDALDISTAKANIYRIYYNNDLIAIASLRDTHIKIEKVLHTEGDESENIFRITKN